MYRLYSCVLFRLSVYRDWTIIFVRRSLIHVFYLPIKKNQNYLSSIVY